MYSILVRETEEKRQPASEYMLEYLRVRSAFQIYGGWWKVVVLLVGGVLVVWGMANVVEWLSVLQ